MRRLEISMSEEELLDSEFKEVLKEKYVSDRIESRDLIFIGLITMMDPPREGVSDAVREVHTAGIKLVMVTGDHPTTALAIARKIGIISLPTKRSIAEELQILETEVNEEDVKAVCVNGNEMSRMSDVDWELLSSKEQIVFSRTSPEQKLTIVQKFTERGYVVAMTGDGVNDSPALKQAAIGIAMGLNGSDVAREAGDVVLLDDNFNSIVVGIREGRLLFDNLKKSVAYTLTHLMPEIVPILFWAMVGTPLAMGAILTLCIDLLTELFPATALAYETAESDMMLRKPRNVKLDRLVSLPLLGYSYGQVGVIVTGVCFFGFFQIYALFGITANDLFTNNNRFFPSANGDVFVTQDGRSYDAREQEVILRINQASWFMLVVIGQACHIFVARTRTISIFEHGVFSNMYVNIAVIIAIAIGCFVVYTPGLKDIVAAGTPVHIYMFYGALINFVLIWGWTEARKAFTRKYPDSNTSKCFAW